MMSNKPYIELESIESTGTQYIKTGVADDGNVEMFITLQLLSTETQYISAAQPISYYTSSVGIYVFDGETSIFCGSTSSPISIPASVDLTYRATIRNGYGCINGVCGNLGNSYISNLDIYLFAANRAGKVLLPASIKVSAYKLTSLEGKGLVDFIPVILTKDAGGGTVGEVGMWDRVTNTFFGNSGTGEFIPHYK